MVSIKKMFPLLKLQGFRNEKGYTLVETMMVTFIFPILFLGIYSVLSMANVIFHTNDTFAQINFAAMQSLRSIEREIGMSSPNVSPQHLVINGDTVRFQIPVDWDNDGDVVTDNISPSTEWGAYEQAGQTADGLLNYWVEYSLDGTQLVRKVLDTTLTEISSQVVANNIDDIAIEQSGEYVTFDMTVRLTNEYGQNGASREYQTTFTSETLLRNATA